jgi:hypothetical protein
MLDKEIKENKQKNIHAASIWPLALLTWQERISIKFQKDTLKRVNDHKALRSKLVSSGENKAKRRPEGPLLKRSHGWAISPSCLGKIPILLCMLNATRKGG